MAARATVKGVPQLPPLPMRQGQARLFVARPGTRRPAPATGLGTGDVLCPEAVNACPEPGDIRFWIFRRDVDARIPNHDPPFERVNTPPSVCRSFEDVPGIDPGEAIRAIVERDFQSVVVLKGVPVVSPAPDTLVNIPTRFTTASPASYDIPLNILGESVVITATAATWTWHFGDGTSDSTSEAGARGRVEHVYRQAASRGAHVVITWTGTFRIAGGPVQQVNGAATTTGEPVPVTVKQARTELVGGSG